MIIWNLFVRKLGKNSIFQTHKKLNVNYINKYLQYNLDQQFYTLAVEINE